MNNQKDEHQKFDKSEKPQYIKPKVVATYRSPKLEKEFANVYGTSGGGGSVDLHYKMDMIIKLLLEQKGYNSVGCVPRTFITTSDDKKAQKHSHQRA